MARPDSPFPPDNRHSRVVAYLKVLLPLVALGLLSTLFLVARPAGNQSGLPVGDISIDGEMRAFRFAARVEDGALSVTGDTATPEASDYRKVGFGGLEAVLDHDSGQVTRVRAETGLFDRSTSEAVLDGGVRVETSTGWRIVSDKMRAAFDASWVESPGPVHLTGDGLDLRADEMRLTRGASGTMAGRALFKGDVRLVYTPQP